MAMLRSLGIHKPTALPYLIAEGILPPNASEACFTWQVVSCDNSDIGREEEELLTTDSCVVWSRGGVVRRIFRFGIEGETVVQAIFARFPSTLGKAYRDSVSEVSKSTPISEEPERARSAKAQPFSAKPGRDHTPWPDHNNRSRRSIDSERALVVILKTQAHVFFLYGTSHIVHLPFEVSAVFALPRGILLQRKTTEYFPKNLTPILPPAPLNSVAFSNPGSSWSVPNSQPLQTLANVKSHPDNFHVFDSLFKQILVMSTRNDNANLPRHLCLMDPLSEMGLVVESLISRADHNRRPSSLPTSILPANEEILYISSSDELETGELGTMTRAALILALTENKKSGLNTLWVVSHVDIHQPKRFKRNKSSASDGYSRRRSSFGPGIGTGTTTPAVRQSVGPFESFITGEDAVREGDYLQKAEDTLASQLDPAFENPGNPAKSSRRVSSLLARSDLSTNRDRNTFPDLTIGQNIGAGLRRGPSVNTQVPRSSFGVPIEHVTSYRPSTPSLQPGHNASQKLSDSYRIIDGENESDEESNSAIRSTIPSSMTGLRNEMIFTKIHSFSSISEGDFQRTEEPKSSRGPQVFTLRRPGTQTDQQIAELVMCILNKSSRQISTLLLSISLLPSRKGKTSIPRDNQGFYQVKICDVRRGDGVLGACKVSDGSISRILLLSETPDGSGELSLQTPWNTVYKLALPSKRTQ